MFIVVFYEVNVSFLTLNVSVYSQYSVKDWYHYITVYSKDKTYWTRNWNNFSVLNIFFFFNVIQAIPISRQSRIIELVLGRLLDKSSQVRKYAVQFLKASLIGNPFAAKVWAILILLKCNTLFNLFVTISI